MVAKILASWGGAKLRFIFIFFLVTIAAAWRFSPFMPHVFFGDDLSYFLAFQDGQCGTIASQLLTTVCADKYRPLPAGFVLLLFSLFDAAISHYMAINIFLQAISATLVFAIAYRLSKENFIVSIFITLAVATSRFAAYQVTQVIGPVEGLALPIFLAIIYSLIRADEENESILRWGWISIFLSFLLIHNHERYIVIAAWLALAFVFLPNFRALPRKNLVALLGACIFLPVFYITYKVAFLHSPFLVGTGGTHLAFDLDRVLSHLYQAILSIVGFNEGPEYLIGVRLKSLPWYPSIFLAAAFATTVVTLISWGVRKSISSRGQASKFFITIRWPFLLITLAGFLLVPAISTIRLEQRWLFAPFILMLLLSAWASGQQIGRNRLVASVFVAILSASSIGLDSIIVKYFNQVFFVYSARYADMVKSDIADQYPGQSTPINLLANPDHCNWTLIKGGFFRVYGGQAREVNCINQNDIHENTLTDNGARIFSEYAQGHLLDITDEWGAHEKAIQGRVLFDFVKRFSDGKISDPVKVSTPSGMGALVLPVETALGPVNTLTVLSGFSYRFDDVLIERGSELRFGLSMIYPAEPIKATVHILEKNGHKPRILLSQQVTSPSLGGGHVFIPVSIPLTHYVGRRVSITFSAQNAGSSVSGQWLGYSNPVILLPLQN